MCRTKLWAQEKKPGIKSRLNQLAYQSAAPASSPHDSLPAFQPLTQKFKVHAVLRE